MCTEIFCLFFSFNRILTVTLLQLVLLLTGPGPRVLNIICISLKFLHTFAWNPTIVQICFYASNFKLMCATLTGWLSSLPLYSSLGIILAVRCSLLTNTHSLPHVARRFSIFTTQYGSSLLSVKICPCPLIATRTTA